MSTVVKYHTDCEEDMLAWMEGMPGQESYRSLFLEVYIENLTKYLRESEGDESSLRALGAVRVTGIEPPLYTWRYTEDLMVSFAVRTIHRTRMRHWLPSWIARFLTVLDHEITVLRLVS